MARTITSANSVFMLGVATIFAAPRKLEGYSADDAFTNESLASAEVSMGVDGRLSAGFVFVPFVQRIVLQADSPSNALFDQWWGQQQRAKEVYPATGVVTLPSIGKKWNLTRGWLTGYKPMPDAQKILRPRDFQITWQATAPSNVQR